MGEYPGLAPGTPSTPAPPYGLNRIESSKGDCAAPDAGESRNEGDICPPSARPGVIPRPGVGPARPSAPPWPWPRSRSTASLRSSSLRWRPNSPVPRGQNCPSMMFSLRPLMRSRSANAAASMRMSTVSSNEQRIRGPVSTRLMPCLVMDMRCPRYVITSTRMARWR